MTPLLQMGSPIPSQYPIRSSGKTATTRSSPASINNNDPDTYTDVNANIICYDSAGEIVGGGTTNIVFVPGDDYMGFASYIDAFDSVASVEVFPTFSFNSVTYEGSDFWSEISILDDISIPQPMAALSGVRSPEQFGYHPHGFGCLCDFL